MPVVEDITTARPERHTSGGCHHQPPCPGAAAVDRKAARIVSWHPEQGWSLLCNGVILFEDDGELLPDGRAVAPRRTPAPLWPDTRPRISATAAGRG